MTFTNFEYSQPAPAPAAAAATATNTPSDQQQNDQQSLASFLQAKRQEVAQKLEALITFQDYSSLTPLASTDTVQPATNTSSTAAPTVSTTTSSTQTAATTDLLQGGSSSVSHVDSSDWFTFASLMDGPPLPSNNVPSYDHQMEPIPIGPVPIAEPIPSASRRVSSMNDYVVSDRLTEILPDLDMKDSSCSPIVMNPPDEDDHNGLAQFFQDPNAWLMPSAPAIKPAPVPSLTSSLSSSDMPPLPMPRLVRKISAGSSTKSGNKSAPKTASERIRERKKTNGARRKLGRPSAFPQKLHTMLTAIAHTDVQYNDIVAFVADGSGFHIHDIDAFVEVILPKYFKMSSFSSFQRQLQLYNFKRVSRGGAYQHPLFHRDAPQELHKMVRKQSKPSNFVLSVVAQSA